MPYDSNGVATINRQRAVTGQTVQAAQVNTPFDDTQSMLSQVLLRSGVAPMTGALNMNGYKQTNVDDPELDTDGANKGYVDAQVAATVSSVASNARKIETVNANRLALLADKATSFRVTGARTITLTAAATLLANWWCEVWAVDGQVTIDPDASETINGNTTLILNAGQKSIVFCSGTAFFAFVTSDAQTGLQLEGYSFGLTIANNSVDPSNDIDISSGKAASDTSPFNIIQLSSPISKDIRFPWSVGTNQGGLDTGSVSTDARYYIWLIQRSDTLVTDVLFSLSSSAPTMPANYNRKRLVGSFIRASGLNSKPRSILVSSSIGENQDWTSFTGSRFLGIDYQNLTGRAIAVSIAAYNNGGVSYLEAGKTTSSYVVLGSVSAGQNYPTQLYADIPSGYLYRVRQVGGSSAITSWAELI